MKVIEDVVKGFTKSDPFPESVYTESSVVTERILIMVTTILV